MLKSMISNKAALVFFVWTIILSSSFCCAEEQREKGQVNPCAEELFAMAERLEKAAPWGSDGIDKIEEITGRIFKERGYFDYVSIDKPSDKLLRCVELSRGRGPGCIAGMSLELPKQGLGITLDQVLKRYGKWSYKTQKHTYDAKCKTLERFGYRTLIGYVYKRENGGYLRFDFDDDKAKQLRTLQVIGP